MGRELYLILGIGETARGSEVRKAYRRLARKYHPDINPGDRSREELFRRIAEAYEVLSDPEKRDFYDQHGYAPHPEDESESVRDPHPAGRGFGFEGILDDFFIRESAGSSRASVDKSPEESYDLDARVSLSFRESMTGLTTHVELIRRRRCDGCRGSGRSEAEDHPCDGCGGRGRVARLRGQLRFPVTCPECHGSGRTRSVCDRCSGRGTTARTERVRVDIPPGVSSGSRLRFPGRGHAHPGTGDRGDLFVVTSVSSDPFFRRAGDNLYCTVPVTIPEAVLGGKISVPTIDGAALLRIPPGVQPGQTLRLRGKGAPSLRADGLRGDQYVEMRVVVPKVIDERSRELLRELQRLDPDDPRKKLVEHAG